MKIIIFFGMMFLCCSFATAQNPVIRHVLTADPSPSVWNDEKLEQTQKGEQSLNSNADKEVGVYYSNWFSFPTSWPNKGGCTWAEPELGWYESADLMVIDQHTEWLADAGVDFVVFDFSNNCGTEDGNRAKNQHLWAIEDNAMAFVERQVWRKKNGMSFLKYAVFLGGCGVDANFTNGFFTNKGNQIYNYYLTDPEKRELYFELNDKPFLGIWGPENLTPNVSHPDFTCQKIGSGLGKHNLNYNHSSYWSWEEYTNPGYSMYNGMPECMTVQAGLRGTGGINLPGWLNDGQYGFGNITVPRNNGQTFRDQLDLAIKADVRIIMVQSFNEWTGCPDNPGEEMNPERSNDIEPMKGGHGDLYMRILKSKVRKFKGICLTDTIVFEQIDPIISDSIITVNAISNAGLPLSYEVITGPAIINGNQVEMTNHTGNVSLRAYHNGNDTICESGALCSFKISNQCESQSITFDPIQDHLLGKDTIVLFAMSDSGLPVTFSLVSGPAIFISDSSFQLTGSEGKVVIRASQPGNFTFCEAAIVTQSFYVSLPPHACNDCEGYVNYERWDNIQGGKIDLIPVDSESGFFSILSVLESPKNIGDFYGTRLSGYLCAPYTGEYTFYLSGDDGCQFWMSKDESMTNKQLIAYVNDWTPYRNWNLFPSQKSAIVSLSGGQKHYIEILLKENNGEDHVSVRWTGPNNIDDIISGQFLDPVCLFQTIEFPVACEQVGDSLFKLNATSASGLPIEYKILSGPAVLNGDTIKLTADRGLVAISALQPGGAGYCRTVWKNKSYMLSASSLSDIEKKSCTGFINVYPNPTEGEVYITWEPYNNQEKIEQLEILDFSGRIILTKSTGFSSNNKVDLTGFNNGLYFLHFTTSMGKITKLLSKI